MLSIIIPSIRKVPNHLIEASIRSAMERSREVVSEIVLVDNSGMSTSWPEAESASSNDLRVRIVRTATRLCMADNWNFAIAQAKNQHGILLHDDDRLTSMFDDIGNDVSSIESFRVYPYILAFRRMRLRVNFSNSFHKAGRDSIFYRTPKLCSTIFNFNAVQTAGGWQAKDGLLRKDMDTHPLFDWSKDAVKLVNIAFAGRFGQWKYFWTDDCINRAKHLVSLI